MADMRLWTIHPKHLDTKGLVALWREALLAKAVLYGQTTGYRNHSQLDRFRETPSPKRAINAYLAAVYDESLRRGYSFNRLKFRRFEADPIPVTSGQIEYEASHLIAKLDLRDSHSQSRVSPSTICLHPMFREVPGCIEAWERVAA